MDHYLLIVEAKTGEFNRFDILLGLNVASTKTWMLHYETRADADESIKHLQTIPDIVDIHLYKVTELKIEE